MLTCPIASSRDRFWPTTRRGVEKAAYEEYKVTRQCSTGNAEAFVAAEPEPTRWFSVVELGRGRDCGPSIEATRGVLKTQNAQRKAAFEARERAGGPKVKAAVTSRDEQRRKEWQAHRRAARMAGVRMSKGVLSMRAA